MTTEIVLDDSPGYFSVVAIGEDAPLITGSFGSNEEYRRVNSDISKETATPRVAQSLLRGMLSRLVNGGTQ